MNGDQSASSRARPVPQQLLGVSVCLRKLTPLHVPNIKVVNMVSLPQSCYPVRGGPRPRGVGALQSPTQMPEDGCLISPPSFLFSPCLEPKSTHQVAVARQLLGKYSHITVSIDLMCY